MQRSQGSHVGGLQISALEYFIRPLESPTANFNMKIAANDLTGAIHVAVLAASLKYLRLCTQATNSVERSLLERNSGGYNVQ